MIKKVLILLFTVCASVTTWGAKAYPGAVTVTQKDGSKLTIVQYGDEHFHYVATTDGVLLYQEEDDFFIAHVADNGKLFPTKVLAHNAGQRTRQELQLISMQDRSRLQVYATEQSKYGIMHEPLSSTDNTLFPHTGSPKALVLLADFQDRSFKNDSATTVAIFDNYLNAKSTPNVSADNTLRKNTSSVYTYFSKISNKTFTPQFKIGALVHLSHNMKYYGEGQNDYMSRFVPEVCSLAHQAGVDFSEYDMNNDGYVDLVYIIYAGYGQNYGGNSTNCIWPKSGTITCDSIFDGKRIRRYGVHNELNYSPSDVSAHFNNIEQINGIGLFCHEFSHCMGMPDIYPTTSSAQNAGNPSMEYWSIMDSGTYTNNGYTPTMYTAWEREFFGWLTIDTLTSENLGQTIEMYGMQRNNGKAYRVFKTGSTSGKEYVILEVIEQFDLNYSLGLNYGHGLLITHVDYDKTAFSLSSNSVNNVIGHPRMTIVPADGEYISYYLKDDTTKYAQGQYKASHKGDPYPGTSQVTQIDEIALYDGTISTPFLNITEQGNGKCITFQFGEQPTEPEVPTRADGVAAATRPLTGRIFRPDGTYVGVSAAGLPSGLYIIDGRKLVIK